MSTIAAISLPSSYGTLSRSNNSTRHQKELKKREALRI
jgi:hypothetical protein